MIVERCCENKAHDCAQEQVRGLGIEWSNVRVEQRLIRTGARIPDVSLCFGEDLVLAIEVHVSNAVDATKAHDYDSRGVRWVEVEGSERIFAKPKWAIALPLPIENTNITRNWVCGECLKEIESQRRLQEYMARARARMEAEARQLPARKQISGESRKQVLQASSEVQKDSPLPVSSQSLPSKEPSLLKKWPSDVSAAAQVVDEMVVELRYRGTHPTDLRYHTPKPVQLRYQIVQATANGEPCFWLDERTSIGEKLPLGKENALLTANKIDALKSLCSDRLAQWERDGFEIMEVSRWKHADTPRTKTGSE